MSNIFAIDYGTKYIGLAVADTEIKIATPIKHLQVRKHGDSVSTVVKFLSKQEDVKLIVIGFPSGVGGKDTQISNEVKQFAEDVYTQTQLPYLLWDETLTSKQALLNSASNKKLDTHSIAAQIILKEYLEHEELKTTSTKDQKEIANR